MPLVQFIDGTRRAVPVLHIQHVGDEGARRGTALYEGKEYPVYCNSIDGDHTWYEQMTFESKEKQEYAAKHIQEHYRQAGMIPLAEDQLERVVSWLAQQEAHKQEEG